METPTEMENKPENPMMSLGSRLTNVFVAPGEVFDELAKTPPRASNWVVPLVIAAVVGSICVFVMFSQPALIQTLRDQQDARMHQQVAAGKMTQKQADDASAVIDKYMGPSMMKALGILSAIFMNAALLFFIALVVWLVGKLALRAPLDYARALEVTGLAMMISILGTVVTTLLIVIYGNLAVKPGPVLLISHFDPKNVVHRALAALDLISLWHCGVLSVGLSRIARTSFISAAVWIFGLWLFWSSVGVFLAGLGQG